MSDNVADNLENVYLSNRLVHYNFFTQTQLAKAMRIFKYSGLDEHFPPTKLERALLTNGCSLVFEANGVLTSAEVSATFEDLDEYKQYHVHLDGETYTKTSGIDAVLVPSDSNFLGIMPLISEHALMDAQVNLTLYRALINLRTNYIIEAKDENTRSAAIEFERQLQAGNLAILFTDSPLIGLEGASVHNTPTSNNAAEQIVTLAQFISAKYYGELGIALNNDMKSQYVNETQIRATTGQPLIYDMLACREEALKKINEMFGLDIQVSISSTWDGEISDARSESLDSAEEFFTEDGSTEPVSSESENETDSTEDTEDAEDAEEADESETDEQEGEE